MPLKRKLALICFLAACGSASAALAESRGFYFAGYMGLKVPAAPNFSAGEVSYGVAPAPGKKFAGSLGFQLSPHWRIESAVSYRVDDSQRMGFSENDSPLNEKMKSFAGLVSFYYDFETPGKIKPFVGIGAGYVSAFSDKSEDNAALVGQVGAGVNYRATPNLSFTGAYHYLEEAPLGVGEFESDYGGHEIRFGLTYKLPYKFEPKPRPRP